MAIVTGKPYQEIYDMVNDLVKSGKGFKQRKTGRMSNARTGVWQQDVRKLMERMGFEWIPIMKIGKGCTVHLKADELPAGRILCNVSRHYTAVIDGVINDTYDTSREGTRCVYGYYRQKEQPIEKVVVQEQVAEIKGVITANEAENKVKPTSKDTEKLNAALEKKKRWTTKLKRATNALKKIERTIKYYEKKKAKA